MAGARPLPLRQADAAGEHVDDEERQRHQQDPGAPGAAGFRAGRATTLPPLRAAAVASSAAPSFDAGAWGKSSGANGSVSRPLASATGAPAWVNAAEKTSAPDSTSGRKVASYRPGAVSGSGSERGGSTRSPALTSVTSTRASSPARNRSSSPIASTTR